MAELRPTSLGYQKRDKLCRSRELELNHCCLSQDRHFSQVSVVVLFPASDSHWQAPQQAARFLRLHLRSLDRLHCSYLEGSRKASSVLRQSFRFPFFSSLISFSS